ncbi:lytic transglycosylase domain-containing protein [Streptomyces gobiensis]|uniref:lytic transglycosylase domain-containing protein n=1 Tax=Streptomyces gobiensis TaxID=2875706 RepID=UPI001E4F73AB|nr:lytic transglycosylase domain-containing protein [Streptomyces gobiensis]UGY95129.1 lytic transglycosylase domain-containing protein [Streptomyces gobiensis]
MVTLTASQAPGVVGRSSEPAERAAVSAGPTVSGDSPYRTELPPLVTHEVGSVSSGSVAAGRGGIPATVLDAYRAAEAALAKSAPGCNLRWELLAAIGQVESGQARGGRVDASGTTLAPILGPQLNGDGFAVIRDTDNGLHDGDGVFDRAVGPMQFIPSTWAVWGADSNGDGKTDPNNIYDAALAAGRYLCAGGRDLSDPYDLDRAILGYNRSTEYLRVVKSWFAYFKTGYRELPDSTGTAPRGSVPKAESPSTPRPTPIPTPTSSSSPASPPPAATPSPTPKTKTEQPRREAESDELRVTVPEVELPDVDTDADTDTDTDNDAVPATGKVSPLSVGGS